MKKLSLKGKLLFISFVVFLIISGTLFNFDQMTLAVVFLIVAIIFAILLEIYHKNNFK